MAVVSRSARAQRWSAMNFPFPLGARADGAERTADEAGPHSAEYSPHGESSPRALHELRTGGDEGAGGNSPSLDQALSAERRRLDHHRDEVVAAMCSMGEELAAIARRAEIVDELMEPHGNAPDLLSA
jgi:hypothetical protein